MAPKQLANLKQAGPGTTALRKPDAIRTSAQQAVHQIAVYQLLENETYSITARQSFFNHLDGVLQQFQHGDTQIVIEVRFINVPAAEVAKFQAFMIPDAFETFENQLPQVEPATTFATVQSEGSAKSDNSAPNGTFVSASETKTKAFPTFMGKLNAKGLKQAIDYCKGRAETDLIRAPTITISSGSGGRFRIAQLDRLWFP